MLEFAKRIVAAMPIRLQQELKRRYYAFMIFRGKFISDEPEYHRLEYFISKGDWVIDIGANIGHYTLKISNLVGEYGRVFAIEPVPATFEILSANVQYFPFKNVTLFNVAASNYPSIVSMVMPFFDSGLTNNYRASLSIKKTGLNVFCIPIDSLPLFKPIRLIKIDVEGHEIEVIEGMRGILNRDHPILIIETNSKQLFELLKSLGYTIEKYSNSPNFMFLPPNFRRNDL